LAALYPELAVAVVLAANACSPTTKESRYELDELDRDYSIVTSVDHDPKRPAPVVVALHAYATEAGVLEAALDLPEMAVRDRGFLLVVPHGTKDSKGAPFWNATRACCDAERRGPDDLGYLRAVLRDVRKRYAVDAKRVVAIGVSNGGFMAYRWACAPGGDLGAVVSISGAALDPSEPPCTPSRPVSILHVHGDADDVVLYRGGVMNGAHYPSVEQSVNLFTTLDGCRKEPARGSPYVRGIGLVAKWSRWRCPGSVVELWTTPGGGHQLLVGSSVAASALDLLAGEREGQGAAR
jgi:polyhydroxybutyrate depolymerase